VRGDEGNLLVPEFGFTLEPGPVEPIWRNPASHAPSRPRLASESWGKDGKAVVSTANIALEPKVVHVHEMDVVIASAPMNALMAMVSRVARGDAAVLITGETGTGKELIARAIHAHSPRAAHPWVDINCAALPEHLVESELFGHEKGAFSGADTAKPGLFEMAGKGTLFLDEIGELEPKVQVKLLRILDGMPYYRLGGTRKVTVAVRIIAATNRPLEDAIKSGRFRKDLYHRLSQLQLRVPPLRERTDDIPVLAEHFLRQSYPGMRLSADTIVAFQAYSWPGNVRELRNVVLQTAVSAAGDEIRLEDLPNEIAAGATTGPPERWEPEHLETAPLDTIEKQSILRTLSRTDGHQGRAAQLLGISRRTLSRKLRQYRIDGGGNLDSQEQRDPGCFRATLGVPVTIVSRHGEQVATSLNISGGGIAVQTVAGVSQLEETLLARFSIPGQDKPISAHAQVMWTDTQGRAGLRFTALADAEALRLQQWLRDQQAEEAGR
jgi:DNA-binding NtrC family response regulator